MAPHHWQQLKEILGEALEREGEDRTTFVAEKCGTDTALQQEVENYLKNSGQSFEACAEKIRETLLNKLPSERIGHRLGAYRIVQEIGRGGMGSVFLAARADGQFEKQVAIKLLKRGTDTDEIVGRFRAERQILAQLEHQSIARLLDAGTTDDGLPYFVMEYVSGKPITTFAREHNLTIEQRLELFLKVCAAVERAHRDHIVHRDLKPTNILVNSEGDPKLLDFGIAKLLEPGENALEATATNQQRFTPTCVSPEQTRGEPVTIASDIYALGALLYELLTERRPHEFSSTRPSSEELARVVCDQEPKLPSAVATAPATRAQLQGDLDNIVMLALEKEPAKRYASVAQFGEDIRRHLNARPVEAPPHLRHQKLNGVRIGLLVAAAIILFFGIGFVLKRNSAPQPARAAAVAPIKNIAILPFEPLVHSKDDEFLGLGMADAIIGRLSGLRNLVVLPTAAVTRVKQSTADPIGAGRELNVDSILCGTVQRSGDRVRVTVQLVNVATRQTLWATTFDHTFTDIFSVQDTISHEVARSLALNLTPEDQKQLAKHSTTSTAAYDFYLLGLSAYNQRSKEGLATAIKYFQRAIEQDPNYALAYALMADSYCLQSYYMYRPATEVQGPARAAAEQAVRIDNSLAEGYLALAMVQPMPDMRGEVSRLLRRAIELNPNLALAHQRYAWQLAAAGDLDGALAEMKRSQQLDPLSAVTNSGLGTIYSFAHRFDLALRYSEKAAELNPDLPLNQGNLATAYMLNRRYEEAIRCHQRALELSPDAKIDNMVSVNLVLWHAGKVREAEEKLPEILKLADEGKVDPYTMALIFSTGGNKDEAFKWFDRSLQNQVWQPGFIRFDPLLDPLRDDPRFNELLVRHGRSDLVAATSNNY